MSKLVKKWTSDINLKGNYGAHTLRKTFEYIKRKVFGVGFEIICKRYNHSSPTITMRYLGIEDKEVNGIPPPWNAHPTFHTNVTFFTQTVNNENDYHST